MGVGRKPSFVVMMVLTTSFFLVEIIVGYMTNSMALVADSFHMLSDIISLGVGYFALKFSRKRADVTTGNTFGWVRAGVLGALVNAVFLVALCLSISISALKRFFKTEKLNNPLLILGVGIAGLVVNILGMFLFHGHAGGHGHSHGGGHGHSHGSSHKSGHEGGHGHSHGHSHKSGHGHSHEGGHGHSHGHSHKGEHGHEENGANNNNVPHVIRKDVNSMENGTNHLAPPLTLHCTPDSPSMRRFQERAKDVNTLFQPQDKQIVASPPSHNTNVAEKEKEEDIQADKGEGSLNMKGVYLHILGDALGSVIVIIAALIVHFVHDTWTLYVDPALSIFMVAIILKTSVPLLKESSMILLQNVPSHIQVKQIEDRLLDAFPEIIGIHEFHVWQLTGSKIIASVHVKFSSRNDYQRISTNLKEFFHYEGIHSTTFQPEFEEGKQTDFKACLLACVSKSCQEKLCCSTTSTETTSTENETKTSKPEEVPLTNSDAISNGDATVTDIVKNVSCHDNDASCHGDDVSCHGDDVSCDGNDVSCHVNDVSCHGNDVSCHDNVNFHIEESLETV